MKKLVLILYCFAISQAVNAQQKQDAVGFIRAGNKLFAGEKYAEAEIAYRKALEKDPQSKEALYNLGTAQYQQKKFEEAAQSFNKSVTNYNENKTMQAMAYHNLGNTYLMSKKSDEAIQAYKEALKRNPGDLDTKHNLLLAMKEKQQQQQQQQNQKNQSNQNKDKKDDNKDGKGDNQDKKDGKGKEDDKKDGSKNGEGNKGDQESDKNGDQDGGKEPEERKGQMSQEQAEKLLEALQNEEKKTQAKMMLIKGKPKPVKTEKDW